MCRISRSSATSSAPKIDSLKATLDTAGADLQKRWDEWNSSGGLRDSLMVGVVTPAWENDPSLMKHPVTDWLDRLFGGGDTSSQADRLQEMFAGMPPIEILDTRIRCSSSRTCRHRWRCSR